MWFTESVSKRIRGVYTAALNQFETALKQAMAQAPLHTPLHTLSQESHVFVMLAS